MALQQLGVVLPRVAFEVGERALPQIDNIIEFLNAGDLGRLVSCCCYLRGRRPSLELRLRVMRRCSVLLERIERALSEEWDNDDDTNEPVYRA